jgi:hypothetical protein
MRCLGRVTFALLLALPAVARAAPIADGSAPLQCSIRAVMTCDQEGACVRGTAATVSLPTVVVVDVGQRLIGGAPTGRTVKIEVMGRDSGRMMLYGTDLGVSWSLAIKEDSGDMSAAVIDRSTAFLLFGGCAAS